MIGCIELKRITIYLDSELLDEILESTQMIHPREIILLLRGKKTSKKDSIEIRIRDCIIPPMPVHGAAFSSYNQTMLPFYLNIMGTYHSHPNGNPNPSIADLNNFIGLFVAIAIPPYSSVNNIYAYDKGGNRIPVKIQNNS